MMPGMKVGGPESSLAAGGKAGKDQAAGEEEGEEEEEEEEAPALPTPRKRLMNFKIPLVRGSQRRDQQHSVVARRRLYRDDDKQEKQEEGVQGQKCSIAFGKTFMQCLSLRS